MYFEINDKYEEGIQTDSVMKLKQDQSSKDIQTEVEQNEAINYTPGKRSESIGDKLSVGRVVDEIVEYLRPIKFINIIFLPFNPTFQMFSLAAVIIKSILGPLQSIYPFVSCDSVPQPPSYLKWIKFLYLYVIDIIYCIDIFLHMVHRQVVDEAMKREHMPKSIFLLLIDILSILPLFKIATASLCPEIKLIPNILAFNELFIVYRITKHFNLLETHSVVKLAAGYTIFLIILVNGFACFILLITLDGFCSQCSATKVLDWRMLIQGKFTDITDGSQAYTIGTCVAAFSFANKFLFNARPNTYSGFVVMTIMLVFTYLFHTIVIMPKMFAEVLLRMREKIAKFHPRASRIVNETKNRNSSQTAYKEVEHYYKMTWKNNRGQSGIPPTVLDLPMHLRQDILHELFWPVFFHSPTFRETSEQFKQYLSQFIRLDYKLAGERFFAGAHCYSNLYYIKSGIVQVICADDSTSPMLSVASGTIFGDISFYLPPLNRKVMVRCFTFCELIVIPRSKIIMAMHKCPADREMIVQLVHGRIQHARELYACKHFIRGIDRSENEGVAWIKRRWWAINKGLGKWKLTHKDFNDCLLPIDNDDKEKYHCPKYIGQLVFCNQTQLQKNSIFANVSFPWLLFPNSNFTYIWLGIMKVVVCLVIILYPPNLAKYIQPLWFRFFMYFVDVVFMIDILITLVTILKRKHHTNSTLLSVVLSRCKRFDFLLDILASPWMDNFYRIFVQKDIQEVCLFNRILKIHIFFYHGSDTWNWMSNPLYTVFGTIIVTQFIVFYVGGYFLYTMKSVVPQITTWVFFGKSVCVPIIDDDCSDQFSILKVFKGWIYEIVFVVDPPENYFDLILGVFVTWFAYFFTLYIKSKFLGTLYLKSKDIVKYHGFVSTLIQNLKLYMIHPQLMSRLVNYLTCHWKYYEGMEVINPINIKNEPFDIYWKFHGAPAEKIIGESKAFMNSDPALIAELSEKAFFLIFPSSSTLYHFGSKVSNLTWLIKGTIRCEYYNENAELMTYFPPRCQVLTPCSFAGKTCNMTFITETDCQILSIDCTVMTEIIKHYPGEWEYLLYVRKEMEDNFDKLVIDRMKNYKNFKKNQKSKRSNVKERHPQKSKTVKYQPSRYEGSIAECNPESRVIILWSHTRFIFVIMNIVVCALKVGSGAHYVNYLTIVRYTCKIVSMCDIVLKLSWPYYDNRGLIISATSHTIWHYISRGFLADICGILPFGEIINYIAGQKMTMTTIAVIDSLSSYFHIYLILGLINYHCDIPTASYVYLRILKWNIPVVLSCITTGSFFVAYCIDFTWNQQSLVLKNMTLLDTCWIPKYISINKYPTLDQLHTVFVQGLTVAQSALFNSDMTIYTITTEMGGALLIYIFIGGIFSYAISHCQAILLLQNRRDDVFQHKVADVVSFLSNERVDRDIIKRVSRHFNYWWDRTLGVDIRMIMRERMGHVFRQDFNFYFYKKTLATMDTILHGGKLFQRNLANYVYEVYYLGEEHVALENEVTDNIYVIHRGSVMITRGGERLATLTKGGIIGVLDSPTQRPLRITVTTLEPTDILHIPTKDFHITLTDNARTNITKEKDHLKDFLTVKHAVPENPFNTIEYILRGKKLFKLPNMNQPVTISNNMKYCRFLYCSYLWGPSITAIVSTFLVIIPFNPLIIFIAILLDVFHVIYMVSDLFTMRIVIENFICVRKYIARRKLIKLGFYLELLSVTLPTLALVMNNADFHLFRLLRLHLLYRFYRHFCKNFQFKYASVLLKFNILVLFLHLLACVWTRLVCLQPSTDTFVQYVDDAHLANMREKVNSEEWRFYKRGRIGCGCIRYYDYNDNNVFFLLPKKWIGNYILSLSLIIFTQTHTNMTAIVPRSITESYLRVVIVFIQYILDIWLTCAAIGLMYSKYRKLYLFHFKFRTMVNYFKLKGLSVAMGKSILKYSQLLSKRQSGIYITKMLKEMPTCLHEDMMSSLYIHHLHFLAVFVDLPECCLRQIIVHMQRVVVFPGNTILKEGEITNCIYFIHEGEVERWQTDSDGDMRMLGLLAQNSSFSVNCGILHNAVNYHTYISRSVVDLVYLDRKDWIHILDYYPEPKQQMLDIVIQNYQKRARHYAHKSV